RAGITGWNCLAVCASRGPARHPPFDSPNYWPRRSSAPPSCRQTCLAHRQDRESPSESPAAIGIVTSASAVIVLVHACTLLVRETRRAITGYYWRSRPTKLWVLIAVRDEVDWVYAEELEVRSNVTAVMGVRIPPGDAKLLPLFRIFFRWGPYASP